MLRLPDVFVGTTREELPAEAAPSSLAIVERAVEALHRDARRGRARLARTCSERLAIIEGALARIAARAPERVVEQRDRLRDAVRELTDGVAVDEQRLAQEIAILADRLDVQRSCQRFARTSRRFAARWAQPQPDGVGKRLGLPAAGDAARGEHDGQQGERRGDRRRTW